MQCTCSPVSHTWVCPTTRSNGGVTHHPLCGVRLVDSQSRHDDNHVLASAYVIRRPRCRTQERTGRRRHEQLLASDARVSVEMQEGLGPETLNHHTRKISSSFLLGLRVLLLRNHFTVRFFNTSQGQQIIFCNERWKCWPISTARPGYSWAEKHPECRALPHHGAGAVCERGLHSGPSCRAAGSAG